MKAVRSMFAFVCMFMYAIDVWHFLPSDGMPKLICEELYLIGLKKNKHLDKLSILSEI